MVERWRLVGHQRRPGDPAEVERGLVDCEDAEVDEARHDHAAAGPDDLVAILCGHVADRVDPSLNEAHGTGDHPGWRNDLAAAHRHAPQLLQPQPSTRRARRVSTSRQAIRIATPISTWVVMIERSGRSATELSISTPRFIGPGCMTIASGAARASRSGVRP